MEKEFSTLRQAAGLTVREASEELEISVSTAYRYESGECKPRAKELQALEFDAQPVPTVRGTLKIALYCILRIRAFRSIDAASAAVAQQFQGLDGLSQQRGDSVQVVRVGC